MSNTDENTDQSKVNLDTGSGILTDGAGVTEDQTTQQNSDSLLGETWEKLAVGSGIVAIISVLFLPILSLNLPDSLTQMAQSAGLSGGVTLREVQSLLNSLAQLSSIGGGGSSTQQLSTASTVVSVTLYGIIGGGGLLIAGAAKNRVLAIGGAVVQTLLTLGLAYAVFVAIPSAIKQQLGSGMLGSALGSAASQLVGPGLGLYLLIAASVGGIASGVMAYR